MNRKLHVSGRIRTPMTKQDVDFLNGLIESLVERCELGKETTPSKFAKETIDDITDVLIDMKIDLNDWGNSHAVLMHDDGFCDPIDTRKGSVQ